MNGLSEAFFTGPVNKAFTGDGSSEARVRAQVLVAAEGALEQDEAATDDIASGQRVVRRTKVPPPLLTVRNVDDTHSSGARKTEWASS